VNGIVTDLAGPVSITLQAEGEGQMSAAERKTLTELRSRVGRLQSAVQGANEVLDTLLSRITLIKQAVQDAPKAPPKLRQQALDLEKRLHEVEAALRGNPEAGERTLPEPPSVVSRIFRVSSSLQSISSLPTQTVLDAYQDASSEFGEALATLRSVAKEEMPKLERALDAAGVPHTPGRIPDWKEDRTRP
jgi:ABC-type transporter Mla subunit MlaD